MAVKFTKPEINIAEKIAELDKPSGIAGEAMLRAETPQEQFNLISAGRRNLFINGAMQVAQRGTSHTNVASNGYYTLDRWAYEVSGDAFDLSISAGPAGFPSASKISRNTTASLDASDIVLVVQKIEAQNLQLLKYGSTEAQSITFSFWVKSTATGSYALNLYVNDSGSARIATKSYSIFAEDTWEHKSITFEGDQNGQINNDTGIGMWCQWFVRAGSTYTGGGATGGWEAFTNGKYADGQTADFMSSANGSFEITGVQMEVGKVATPFEYRSYGEELALCQRYYYKRAATVNGDRFCLGNASSTTDFRGFIEFPVEMRANPTFETSGTASHFSIVTGTNGVVTCNDIPTAGLQKWGGLINAETASGLTAGHGGQLRAASTSAYIAASAEL